MSSFDDYKNSQCNTHSSCSYCGCVSCCCVSGRAGSTGATSPMGPKDANGLKSSAGGKGKSAFQIAVDNGYVGTKSQWLNSIKDEPEPAGSDGLSATVNVETAGQVPYDDNPYVVNHGFIGTEQ